MSHHSIVINNHYYNNSDNIVVNFSYVLLKGTIITNYKSPCNNKTTKDLVIRNKTSDKNAVFQLNNNKFKSVLELVYGQNQIVINYCCYNYEITINFKPRTTEYCVVPIYIVLKNHNGEFQAPLNVDNSVDSACDRITVGIKLIQTLIAEKFHENGFQRKTFQLENDIINSPKCRIFHSQLTMEECKSMKSEELWCYFGRELINNYKNPKIKYIAFISCTRYRGEDFTTDIKTHDDIIALTEAHAALGGGGLAIFGTGCLYTWPQDLENVVKCFVDNSVVDKTKFMDDSCYR